LPRLFFGGGLGKENWVLDYGIRTFVLTQYILSLLFPKPQLWKVDLELTHLHIIPLMKIGESISDLFRIKFPYQAWAYLELNFLTKLLASPVFWRGAW